MSSFLISLYFQVIIKIKSKHVGGAFSKKNKCKLRVSKLGIVSSFHYCIFSSLIYFFKKKQDTHGLESKT